MLIENTQFLVIHPEGEFATGSENDVLHRLTMQNFSIRACHYIEILLRNSPQYVAL